MELNERIAVDPAVLAGKPIIRGTRVPVALILQQLEEGWSIDEVLAGYPHLDRDDVLACIRYARQLAESESVFPV